MPYAAKHLHEGEHAYLDTRAHWSALFLPSLETAVVLSGEGAGFVLWSSAPVWFGWVLLGIGLIVIARFLARLASWRSTDLVITSMRVIYRNGVFHRRGIEIPLSSVQNVEYSQSLLARLLGKGDLQVESAGSNGREPFVDIPNPSATQSLINRAIEEAHQQGVQQFASAPSGTQNESIADEIEHLANLHQRGVITDDEFIRLKAELIAANRAHD